MYSVLNRNSQLYIATSTTSEYYEFPTFKSIAAAYDVNRSSYYVSINFIANDKNNSLRLYMVDIDNQGAWTNTSTGAKQAVDDISSWAGAVISPSLSGVARNAFTRRESGSSGLISAEVYSISFASVGTANAQISSNGGGDYTILKPGETVSYSAGDINNYFSGQTFAYDTTLANSELLVIYTY